MPIAKAARLIVAMVACASLAACGGGGDEVTTTTVSSTTTTTAVTTTLPDITAVLRRAHEGSTGSDPRNAGLVKDEVIVDQAGWNRSWAALHAGQSRLPAVPSHDFTREHLLIIQRGYNTGGYSIGEARGLVDGVNITVNVAISAPGAECVATQAFTFPWVVLSVPADVSAASVIDKQTAVAC